MRTRLRDIMQTDVVTLTPELTMRDAMELLASRRLSGAPVLSGNRVIGVFSASDVMEFLAQTPGVPEELDESILRAEPTDEPTSYWQEGDEPLSSYFIDFWSDSGASTDERMRAVSGPEWNVLEEHTVGEAMNYGVIALSPDDDLVKAANLMRSAGVHRLLIVDDERLVGIVSTNDVADALADEGSRAEFTRNRRQRNEEDRRTSE